MDIDLLSKMVKELILDNDRVVLPGLGSFVAEIVPSTFSDKGYTINPPYRKLYFRSKPDEGSDLAMFYAKSNSVPEDMAERIIADFIAEMKEILFARKTVVFPGLGRLRATKENNVFFVADLDLDIYPEGFGLEPISLKTHQETREEVSAAVADLKDILKSTAPAVEETTLVEEIQVEEEIPVVEEILEMHIEEVEEVDEVGEIEERVEAEDVKTPWWKTLLKVTGWILAAVAILSVAYVAVAHLFPDWIDQFLYTPEELEILNYR